MATTDKPKKPRDPNMLDLKLDEGLRDQVEAIAVSVFGAKIHHISKRPEITTTLNRLIKLGLSALNQDNSLGFPALAPSSGAPGETGISAALGELREKLETFDDRLVNVEREAYRPIEMPAYSDDGLIMRIHNLEEDLEAQGREVASLKKS
jgi:hypothetical protein